MPLYVPKGEKIRSGEKINVSEVIEELKSLEFTGYIEVASKSGKGFYLGFLFFLKGEPIIAGVEEVVGKVELLGKDALELILSFDEPTVDVYELDEEKISLCIEYNPDEAFLRHVDELEIEKKHPEYPEYPVLKYGILADNLVESVESNVKTYLSQLKDFTGVVWAKENSKEAIVLLENGKIRGAAYFNVGETFAGNLAVNLLDFNAKIESYAKRPEEIEKVIRKNPEIEVVDRAELFKKYRIRPPEEEEIERILKGVLEDEIVEEGLKKKSPI
ncbi:MAG: DUF2226 domain-containing protein [Archaeoglobus sp.]|nr:DUF2226 domain-containing protein [Archaeoglobus sp.]